jgi:hypothetical protein
VIKQKNNSSTPYDKSQFFKDKIKIPFLKKFNPKIIKREEVDKKIIRKFKKYVRDRVSDGKFGKINIKGSFWESFVEKNLLPPMTYHDGDDLIEFKSFNSNYIFWLFNQKDADFIYSRFLEHKKEEIFQSIKKMTKMEMTDDIIIELTAIYDYLCNFASIYNINSVDISKKRTKCGCLCTSGMCSCCNISTVSTKEPSVAFEKNYKPEDKIIFNLSAKTESPNKIKSNANKGKKIEPNKKKISSSTNSNHHSGNYIEEVEEEEVQITNIFEDIDFFKRYLNILIFSKEFQESPNEKDYNNNFDNYDYSDDDLSKLLNKNFVNFD